MIQEILFVKVFFMLISPRILPYNLCALMEQMYLWRIYSGNGSRSGDSCCYKLIISKGLMQ